MFLKTPPIGAAILVLTSIIAFIEQSFVITKFVPIVNVEAVACKSCPKYTTLSCPKLDDMGKRFNPTQLAVFCTASWTNDKELSDVLTKIDMASPIDGKAFIAKFATDAAFRTAILADVRLVDVWRVTSKLDLASLQNLKNKFIDIGYDNFNNIDLVKYESGTILSNKIYGDIGVNVEQIQKGSPDELPFLEQICIQYSTKAFTPKNTKLQAIDGVLSGNGSFIQLKTTNYKNRASRMNSAYAQAQGIGVKGIELYMELKDMTSTQCAAQWVIYAKDPVRCQMKNDGVFSKIIHKGTDNIWIESDLNLLPK
jgi:hypothetical protein